MLNEVQPTKNGEADYASARDLLEQDDLIELDVKLPRWTKSTRPLKLRVKALSLDAQAQIEAASVAQHPITKLWYTHPATFAAETLKRGVIVPRLDDVQAAAMTAHNPRIINELVDDIWNLSALSEARLAAFVSPPSADAGDATGGGDVAVG